LGRVESPTTHNTLLLNKVLRNGETVPAAMYVIVENLEPCPSPWLLSEYRYVAELFPSNTVFTNVRGKALRHELVNLAPTFREGFIGFLSSRSIKPEEVIVLDPSARRELRPEELGSVKALIIGGIMGDSPRRGRTYKYITSKLPASTARSLGRGQLTIAGTAYILKRVLEGSRLSDIEVREGLKIRMGLGGFELIIELPYTFPYEGGKPVLPEDYLRVIAERSIYYESVSVNECDELRE